MLQRGVELSLVWLLETMSLFLELAKDGSLGMILELAIRLSLICLQVVLGTCQSTGFLLIQGGCHCIATIVGQGGDETFYTHAKWTKPRVLSKLKGLVVNVVAWNRQQITEVSTKEFILGTDNGQLHELAVDEKDKKEKYIKFLYELTELPEALMGLQMETASVINETRYYVMAVTPTRLYFTGFGSLEVKSNAINLHIFVFHFPLSLGVFMPVNRGTIQA
ncbi:vacuolar sorting protein 18-like isoform X1 [Vicia villosa]|uniref:vacuolar sorting protein 18-like isoform X1 n=1 Tax=Vicia villosa TaxID=3911 RepID=UPI00273BA9E2|nr:vacuolar sorting protein 18-like isoform X1 [Vicia villosa]XP_058739840.1 vacuolar sorting protein 18-like isoform X1 [Vicia villosa]XP_058739841.1 vacuolar sorting protein 18-like isoform X1 [Vicia villosa]